MDGMNKLIAEHILALAKKANAKHSLWMPYPQPELQQELEALGCRFVEQEQAKVYLQTGMQVPQVVLETKMPVITAVSNNSHRDVLLRVLYGHAGELPWEQMTSAAALQSSWLQNGFEQVDQNDVVAALPAVQNDDALAAQGSAVHRYLTWLKNELDVHSEVACFVRLYIWDETVQPAQAAAGQQKERPFLTAVVRTQGRREQGLAEVMMCLAAQTDRDFEVLVVGHKLNPTEDALVQRVIAETPEYLRSRIRYIHCEENGRTAPLNMGFQYARGRYIAIYDDDDVVMANWVEEFHKAENKAPGAILHSYVVRQDWQYIKGLRHPYDDLRATGSFESLYCKPFSWSRQFVENNCPLMSLAFPAYVYQQCGLRFDPSLNVIEDWDFLMRSAVLCGVQDVQQVTSIYRWWTNGVTSATLHNQDEWKRSYKYVVNKFKKIPVVLPAGENVAIGKRMQELDVGSWSADRGELLSQPAELFAQQKGVFDPDTRMVAENIDPDGGCHYVFDQLEEGVYTGLLRFDPCYNGGVTLSEITITVVLYNNEQRVFRLNRLASNGWQIENGFIFIQDDPQIYFHLDEGECARQINVEYSMFKNIHPVHIARVQDAVQCSSALLITNMGGHEKILPGEVSFNGTHLRCSYTGLDRLGLGDRLDFVPCMRGGVAIQNMKIQAQSRDNKPVAMVWKNIGYRRGDADVFISRPRYGSRVKEPLAAVTFEFDLTGHVSEETANSFHSLLNRLMHKLLRFLRKQKG